MSIIQKLIEEMAPPPSGGDQNKGASINTLVWAMATITTLTYAGRIYTRAHITKDIGLGDYFVTSALV